MTALRFRLHHVRRALLPAALLLAAVPGSALAADPVIKDCEQNGRLTKTYTQKQYNAALANIPTDLDEYSDCRDVIRRAQLGAAGGGSGSGGTGSGAAGGLAGGAGGGSTGGGAGGAGGAPQNADQALQAATPQERAAVQKAMLAEPVDTRGKKIDLSKSGVGSLGSIPTPLLIVLVVLALAAGAGGGAAVTNRVRRRTPAT